MQTFLCYAHNAQQAKNTYMTMSSAENKNKKTEIKINFKLMKIIHCCTLKSCKHVSLLDNKKKEKNQMHLL